MDKTCIVIAGPTASGKTALAIDIAKHFSTRIISADSRQCYRELNIGVAKPSPQQLHEIHHYFIDSHSIHDTVSAAVFEDHALRSVENIFQTKDVAVMTGGTGLYIRTFCEGLDPVPQTEQAIRQKVMQGFNDHGIAWLQQEILANDPLFFEKGETKNPQRLMRALEVILSTGRSITTFQSGLKKKRNFRIVKFALKMPRNILYERINKRVDQMIGSGLVEEARLLFPFKDLNSLQTVGYRELFDHFERIISLERAIELIKQNSRQYAKRQLTWFRRDEEFHWLDALDPAQATQTILNSEL